MEARENFEPRGCWWVTKQRRGSSMVRYSENSAQRWQSKHDILSFTVVWERCCFPQAWMSLPYLHRFLLSSPHIYFQHKEIWLKIEEGKYTKKKKKKPHKNNPELSWGLCWLHSSLLGSGQESSLSSWRKISHLVFCCPVPSHLQDYFSTWMEGAALHPSTGGLGGAAPLSVGWGGHPG